jgi:hypothetical protein
MANNSDSAKTELGKIIDLNMTDFEEVIKGRNLGEILGIRNLLVQTYEGVKEIKDRFLESIKSGKFAPHEVHDELAGLYGQLLKIENKVIYLNTRIAEIQVG